jgi:hypothetical protein
MRTLDQSRYPEGVCKVTRDMCDAVFVPGARCDEGFALTSDARHSNITVVLTVNDWDGEDSLEGPSAE